jgi:hypothetical protein
MGDDDACVVHHAPGRSPTEVDQGISEKDLAPKAIEGGIGLGK